MNSFINEKGCLEIMKDIDKQMLETHDACVMEPAPFNYLAFFGAQLVVAVNHNQILLVTGDLQDVKAKFNRISRYRGFVLHQYASKIFPL